VKERFFIAVVLPQDIREEVHNFKKIMAEQHHACHAFKSPAHITLHMPFKWESSKRGELEQALAQMTAGLRPFEVALQDFGVFEPRVIFIDVAENKDLRELRSKVLLEMRKRNIYNGDYKNLGFQPHVTIAFRDLRKANFYEAWETFKDQKYERIFSISGITLLKYQSDHWHESGTFPFMDTN